MTQLCISCFSSCSENPGLKKPGVSIKVRFLPTTDPDFASQTFACESEKCRTLNSFLPNIVLARLLFPAPVFPSRTILVVFGTRRIKISYTFNTCLTVGLIVLFVNCLLYWFLIPVFSRWCHLSSSFAALCFGSCLTLLNM